MTTATQIKSEKYQGWTIEKTGDAEYLMIRDAGIYAISVMHSEKWGWTGELMTQQRYASRGDVTASWEVARNEFSGTVPQAVAEANRRAEWVEKNKKTTKRIGW